MPVGSYQQGDCRRERAYDEVGSGGSDARRKCPDGIYIERDFRCYKMLAEVGTFSPRVGYNSIDEFFWEGARANGRTYRQTSTCETPAGSPPGVS
ncbi:MAG: nucleotidyltransferase/DNA polymerase involved in repair [Gemmataceae bacterium]|nr:nucleotidyltransferase/DNA polymerase involved in repair [Gemmataceae bacterium]